MKKKTYDSRKFLNKDHGIAAIETHFDFDPSWRYSGGWEAYVSISDCSRSVRLEFGAYTEKDIDRTLNKISTLMVELEKLGNIMLEHREAAAELIKEAEKDRKQRAKERKAKQSKTLEEVLDDIDSE